MSSVAVIDAGIGGLSTAIRAAAEGRSVTLFEAAPEVSATGTGTAASGGCTLPAEAFTPEAGFPCASSADASPMNS